MTVPALEQAITFLSRADLIATARQQSLPAGVTEILKISSGDNEALLVAQESSRFSQDDVRQAAQFYVQQILFAPDSDHYRVLGVDPDDAEAKIKLHYRLLVRWLHPDKNSSDWEVVFSDRINRAWHSLRTPERRREYDAQLKSQYFNRPISAEPSRELKPSQLRSNNVDERFMSSRAIKRLPIAVFGLLGVSAVFALWWLSQLQPNLQDPVIADIEPGAQQQPIEAPRAVTRQKNIPSTSKPTILPATMPVATIESAPKVPVEMTMAEKVPTQSDPRLSVVAVASPVIKAPEVAPPAKTLMPAIVQKNIQPSVVKQKNTPPEKSLPELEPSLVKTQGKVEKAGQAVVQKSKAAKSKPDNTSALANAETVSVKPVSVALSNSTIEAKPAKSHDASVKQFLQQFSRVYAEGDYFALHNLFTKDLSILSAPPQRSVLRSYRQLFESSQSREIALDHVTWLATEENIVVIASYQAQVLPRGKAETESSSGDIRLDLRMENGQLRIIRLQSDTKNG